MDLIERLFGLSPDGGNGSLEFLLFFLPIILAVVIAVARRVRVFERDS